MCRSQSHGGRRCPHTGQDREAHNRRRRENRAIRANLIVWMRAQDDVLGSDAARLADELEQLKLGQLKGWLREHQVDPDNFKDGVPDKKINPVFGKRADNVRPDSFAAGRRKPAGADHARNDARLPAEEAASGGASAGQEDESGRQVGKESMAVHCLQQRQGTHPQEQALLCDDVVAQEAVGRPGENEARIFVLANGARGVFKPVDGADPELLNIFGHDDAMSQTVNEAVTWHLARELGEPYSQIVPAVVVRHVDGRLGSLAQWRDGMPGEKSQGTSPVHWREAAFFDALTGQQDRHLNNYLIDDDHKVVLIDHGAAFARGGDAVNVSWFVQSAWREAPSGPPISAQQRELLDRFCASSNALGMADVLAADRVAAMRDRAERMVASGCLVDRL